MKKYILIYLLIFTSSCTKEYITKEYNTTNENIYNKEYYSIILSNQQEITTDIRPPYLQAGDSVAICATSNKVTAAELADGINVLESWGLKVKEASNLYNADGRYAGTEQERIDGLQALIDDENIKAIIDARGGYGCAQIIDRIDLTPLVANPKWFVGYSDATVMHAALNNMGIESIHGAMARNLSNSQSATTLKNALFGNYTSMTISKNANCINGEATGRLVGGNLSIIYSLGGTAFDLNVKNAILFIEDTGEANYAIDRMLTNLKLSGKLASVKGIVVGEFINMTQGSDKSIPEIIADKVADLNIPVVYGVNCGHDEINLALYLGRTVTIKVDDTNATITFN